MSNFTDFFPAAGGGGGGIPKYQEFTSSGTFTPTQALIDAGGRVAFLIVAGGGMAYDHSSGGGNGGQVKIGYATLTSTTGCAVTVGAAPTVGWPANQNIGGDTSIAFNSAGGTAVTAKGGHGNLSNGSWGGGHGNNGDMGSGTGVMGYGVGGNKLGGSRGWDSTAKNYGCAGTQTGYYSSAAGPGFVRITWFE